jgi:hypothetical protein
VTLGLRGGRLISACELEHQREEMISRMETQKLWVCQQRASGTKKKEIKKEE